MRLLTTTLVFSILSAAMGSVQAQPPAAHGNGHAQAGARRPETASAVDIHRARPSQASAQSGTGRVGQAAIPRTTVPAHSHAHPRLTRRDATERSVHRSAQRTKSAPAGNAYGHQPRTGDQHGLARGHIENGGPADPRGQRLRHRLAEIDRMRDEAVLRGDTQALVEADRLEHQARHEHAHTAPMPVQPAPQLPSSDPPPATEPPVFTPGYGRLTAQQAHALHRDVKRPPQSIPPAAAPNGEFTPGYGRLTAEQARARTFESLPPVEPMPAPPMQTPVPSQPTAPPAHSH
jgi:hypothetical protein